MKLAQPSQPSGLHGANLTKDIERMSTIKGSPLPGYYSCHVSIILRQALRNCFVAEGTFDDSLTISVAYAWMWELAGTRNRFARNYFGHVQNLWQDSLSIYEGQPIIDLSMDPNGPILSGAMDMIDVVLKGCNYSHLRQALLNVRKSIPVSSQIVDKILPYIVSAAVANKAAETQRSALFEHFTVNV